MADTLAQQVERLEALCTRIHWHPCHECFEDEVCVEQCSIEPTADDVPKGAHVICGNCAREQLRVLKGIAGEKGEGGWMETAAQEARNKDYYRGLVVEIGGLFGVNARTSDDGSVQADVLCAKVPELVRRLVRALSTDDTNVNQLAIETGWPTDAIASVIVRQRKSIRWDLDAGKYLTTKELLAETERIRRDQAEAIARRLQTLHDDASDKNGSFEFAAQLIRSEYVKP